MRNPFEPFPSFGNGGQNDYQGLNACLIMKTERVRNLKRSEHHFNLGSFCFGFSLKDLHTGKELLSAKSDSALHPG